MSDARWQFWIDVGGTFTDCLAKKPDGEIVRHKLLSSGVTKGTVGEGSTAGEVIDASRAADPPAFWRGATCRLLDADGLVSAEAMVGDFAPKGGRLRLDRKFDVTPQRGQTYELATGEEAPIIAVRWLMRLAAGDAIPPITMRLGTTRGTNALLTRSGARTALITTRGFGDILHIGYQNRPRLFDLNIKKPTPLFDQVLEIAERIAFDGEVLLTLDESEVRRQLTELREKETAESLAVCLLNAYQHDAHECAIEKIARDVGFDEVSRSSRVAPLIKLVSRGDTTTVDAYLTPVLREYVGSLHRALGNHDKVTGRQGDKVSVEPASSPPHPVTMSPCQKRSEFRIMTSAGGLVDAENFVGKDSVLSGPAGGVVGFAAAAEAVGFTKAIGFDMGGTSTDVSRWDGRFQRQFETEKAGVRIVAPMLAIETVAAGGGSVCYFDGVKLCVGPNSAGAQPGPACYGAGGPLTVTDVNLLLGKIRPEHFPFRLDRAAAEMRLREIAQEVSGYNPMDLAAGFLKIANTHMAQAIRTISIAQGCDARDYVLVAFGGAAGQHACAVAEELGIRQILSHPDAGVLSAYGIGIANVERHRVQGIYELLRDDIETREEELWESLLADITSELVSERIDNAHIGYQFAFDLRYRGLDSYLTVTEPIGYLDNRKEEWVAAYEWEHERRYGYKYPGREIEIVAARMTGTVSGRDPVPRGDRVAEKRCPSPLDHAQVSFGQGEMATAIFDRENLRPGDCIDGSAIILERNATTIVDPDWQAEMLSDGQLLISREGEAPAEPVSEAAHGSAGASPSPLAADPVLLEIFNNHFAAIAEQMGVTLRNTASSVNVKERLDFSCAVFTKAGELVVNAPHIPVHLGAMGLTVRAIQADNPDMQPGDVFVTNDPYHGGSHLPDITIVTPVHSDTGELLFFTASRAHHAEIGGVRAGSMPPFSKNLAEEGVLIRNFKLVAGGESRASALRDLLTTAEFPSRNVADNLADISAQVAANRQGARDLSALVEQHSLPVVSAYMRHIQAAAETKMRAALAKLEDGRREFVDHLDDGSPIAVAITIAGDSAVIDFTGTGPVLPGNLNANRAIVTAAVMYVFRCLIGEDIPLNEGVLAPLRIVLPECLLNPPSHESAEQCAAIVGGNVETSQRVVDVLLGALNIAAASQGTMNNVLFGDATFGYYETIGGGSGATRNADGASAVHTQMTNTRLTDPEVLEQRYPVRVREFAIRHDSGGAGKHIGGDGIIRRIEFLKTLDVSILSQRRGSYAPYGIDGGEPGALGENTLTRADGTVEHLASLVQFTAQPGDTLTIETPGGGGAGENKTIPN